MEEFEKAKANNLLELGKLDELYEYIKPHLEIEEPYALYLFSCLCHFRTECPQNPVPLDYKPLPVVGLYHFVDIKLLPTIIDA